MVPIGASSALRVKISGVKKINERLIECLCITFIIHLLRLCCCCCCYQAGAWPVETANIPSFALPQELERSVHTVRTTLHLTISISILDNSYLK